MMSICPRCRQPHDSRRELSIESDPLLLTGAARLCNSCVASAVLSDPSAGTCPADLSGLDVDVAA
jgi:hypothetical protein